MEQQCIEAFKANRMQEVCNKIKAT